MRRELSRNQLKLFTQLTSIFSIDSIEARLMRKNGDPFSFSPTKRGSADRKSIQARKLVGGSRHSALFLTLLHSHLGTVSHGVCL
jgi:hypothetical protein